MTSLKPGDAITEYFTVQVDAARARLSAAVVAYEAAQQSQRDFATTGQLTYDQITAIIDHTRSEITNAAPAVADGSAPVSAIADASDRARAVEAWLFDVYAYPNHADSDAPIDPHEAEGSR